MNAKVTVTCSKMMRRDLSAMHRHTRIRRRPGLVSIAADVLYAAPNKVVDDNWQEKMTMGYDKLRKQLARLDELMARNGLTIKQESELSTQLSLIRDFLEYEETLPVEEWLKEWQGEIKRFYDALTSVGRLFDAIDVFADRQENMLCGYLRKIFHGSITQGGKPEEARDLFYELWIGAALVESGFDVKLEEPDLTVQGNGLSQRLGIACKYPSSGQQVQARITDGYAQLRHHGLPGLVVVGIDQIVLKETGLDKSNFIDLRQGEKDATEVISNCASNALEKILHERPHDYPSEVQIDVIMITVTLTGILGSPAGLTAITQAVIHCNKDSPIRDDIEKIAGGVAPTYRHE